MNNEPNNVVKNNDDEQSLIKEQASNKETEWNRTIHFLFSHKRYVIIIFPIILITIFLGSMCSSLQKNGHTLFFILCLVGVILLLVASIFIVVNVKKKFIENKISTNVFLSFLFAYVFLSGFLLMILYKVISMVDNKNILNITGLLSVIVILVYIVSIIGAFYIDINRVKKFFRHKNNK